jgi:hypothetical protein
MKITGTRSYILVEFDYRTVKIQGELTITPAFYAYSNSIKNWEPPYDKTPITTDEKSEIIKAVIAAGNPEFEIIFEE